MGIVPKSYAVFSDGPTEHCATLAEARVVARQMDDDGWSDIEIVPSSRKVKESSTMQRRNKKGQFMSTKRKSKKGKRKSRRKAFIGPRLKSGAIKGRRLKKRAARKARSGRKYVRHTHAGTHTFVPKR